MLGSHRALEILARACFEAAQRSKPLLEHGLREDSFPPPGVRGLGPPVGLFWKSRRRPNNLQKMMSEVSAEFENKFHMDPSMVTK